MHAMKPRRSLGRLCALVATVLVVASTVAASPSPSAVSDPSAVPSPAASSESSSPSASAAASSVSSSASPAASSVSTSPSASASPSSGAQPSPTASSSPSPASPSPSPASPSPSPASSAAPHRVIPTPAPQPSGAAPTPTPVLPPVGTGAPRPFLVPTLAAPLTPTFADGHFLDAPVFTGLTKPTTVRFAPNGKAFVAEKGGVVLEFDSLADTTPTTVIDLSVITDDYWDRGLLSLAIDPGFVTGKPYLYLYLVYDAPPGQTAPIWGDACPSPPGATTDGCVATSELVRVTVDPVTNVAAPASVKVLVHDWCLQFPSHAGGAMAFDQSGSLIVTGGDGASFNGVDYGQRGGTLPTPAAPVTAVNPCHDPATLTSVNPPVTQVSTAEGGQLRAQDIRTTGDPVNDPTGLDGSIIRVDPATGDGVSASPGVAANPLPVNLADPNQHRIIAHGFRNPFRLTIRPGTNEVYVGDVGDQTWEEIDQVLPSSTTRTPTTLPNYGWPCYEGAPKSGFQGLNTNMCNSLYAQANAVTTPLYAYSHLSSLTPTGPCFSPDVNGKMSSAVAGLAFYEGKSGTSLAYPGYQGALFFADYARNCIGVLLPGVDGVPNPATAAQFASGVSHPVDLLTGPGGDLYYVDLDGGRVMEISYHTDPVARATATPSMAHAPVTVHLDGSTSFDPDPNDSIATYQWDLNHDGTFDQTGITYDWSITTPAIYTVTLKVTTVKGFSATTDIVVDATNNPPVPSIDTVKVNGATVASPWSWNVGDTIAFTGSAADTEDGTVAPSGLTWTLVMHHCPAGCHLHFIQTFAGAAGGSFVAPDHEYPSFLELRLTATDSHGSSTTTSIDLMPNSSTLHVVSSPAGLPIGISGVTQATPASVTALRNGIITVDAPALATIGGAPYRFSSWSDGLPQVHDAVASVGNPTVTAIYVPDAPETCAAATTTSPSGSWISQWSSGNGDQDWFRFALTSKRRVILTLGSLPVNGRLELYSSCGTLLATSDGAGTHFEQVTRVLAAGTYRVHVSANGNAASPAPWRLRFRPLGSGMVVLSYRITGTVAGKVSVAGEAMNNSGATRGTMTVTATFLGPTGTVVGRLSGAGFAKRLGDGGITSFRLSGTVAAYASVRFSATSATAPRIPGVTITSLTIVAGVGGAATEKGAVKNTGSATARSVAVARTWYDTSGNVLAVAWGTVSPSNLAAGHSGTFSIPRPAMPTYGGSRSQVRATL